MPKKILKGIIVNNKSLKTVSVLVESRVLHSKYKKIIRRTKKYLAHTENTLLKIGDKVKIIENKPISKLKRWHVIGEENRSTL